MHPARPTHLFYRAKDGLYSMYLPSSPPAGSASRVEDREPLHEFIGRAVAWSQGTKAAQYSILDTFFSNAVSRKLLDAVSDQLLARGGTLRVLLTAPDSAFARGRGRAIKQAPVEQLSRGVGELLETLIDRRILDAPAGDSHASFYDMAIALRDAPRLRDDVSIEVRYYSSPASAAMYFLDDMLATGRFSHGTPAADNPWSLVVQDPEFEGDLFRSYMREFDELWRSASPEPVSNKPLAFQHKGDPRVTVLALDVGAAGMNDLASQRTRLQDLCESLTLEQHQSLRAAWPDDLICVYRGTGATLVFREQRQPESLVDLAVALRKIEGTDKPLPIRVGLAYGRVSIGETSATNTHCFGMPLNAADRLSMSGPVGRILMTEAYYQCCPDAWWANFVTPPMEFGEDEDRVTYRELVLDADEVPPPAQPSE